MFQASANRVKLQEFFQSRGRCEGGFFQYLIVGMVIITLFLGFNGVVEAQQPNIEIEIDGETSVFPDAQPYIDENARTMVPLRFVSETLGSEVAWDGATRTVEIQKDHTTIHLQVDSDIIRVNGLETQMDTRMVFHPQYSRNYVPIRFVSENLGSQVDFETRDGGTIFHIAIVSEVIEEEAEDSGDDEIEEMDPSPETEDEGQEEPTSPRDAEVLGVAMGDEAEDVRRALGEPDREEPSAYGYTWWIYNQDLDNFLQVGMEDQRVVHIYSNSTNWDYDGLQVGLGADEAMKYFPFDGTVSFDYQDVSYQLSQSEKRPLEKYLVYLEDEIGMEIYLDVHDQQRVSGVRFTQLDHLIASKNYSMRWSYRGDVSIPEKPQLTEPQQQAVNRAHERQLLDLVNTARVKRNLSPLTWHQDIAEVAYAHSVDMRENGFFSHRSPTTGNFDDRIRQADISYVTIGENIARGQMDAIAAHEGLMNSYDHRQGILSEAFEALGTGVSERHYTQKFITQ